MNHRYALRALMILMIGGALMAAVFAGLYFTAGTGQQGAADAGGDRLFAEPGTVPIGGPFTLTDHTGATVTDEDFRGRYLLVFFGYTHCPDICPTTLGEIARVMDLLGDQAQAVQPLFISVDPKRDTPAVLAEYVRAFHPAIVGLTGRPDQVGAVARAYRVFYDSEGEGGAGSDQPAGATGSGDYPVQHSGNTYLMSPDGDYLTHFAYGTSPETMAETIRKAMARFGTPNA